MAAMSGPTLTARQVVVLQRAREGFTSKQIAEQTGLNRSLVHDIRVTLKRRKGLKIDA